MEPAPPRRVNDRACELRLSGGRDRPGWRAGRECSTGSRRRPRIPSRQPPGSAGSTGQRISMVTDDRRSATRLRRFDDDQVDPHRGSWESHPSRQRPALEHPAECRAEVRPLAPAERVLGQPEVPTGPPADLDEDDRRWWPRIEGDDVDLLPAHVEVTGKDRPALGGEAIRDERLRGVAEPLPRCSCRDRWPVHPPSLAIRAYASVGRVAGGATLVRRRHSRHAWRATESRRPSPHIDPTCAPGSNERTSWRPVA